MGLLAGHWLFFGLAYSLVRLRDVLLQGHTATLQGHTATHGKRAALVQTPIKGRHARVAHTPTKREAEHTPSKARAMHTPTKREANGSMPATPVRASARLAAKTKSMTAL